MPKSKSKYQSKLVKVPSSQFWSNHEKYQKVNVGQQSTSALQPTWTCDQLRLQSMICGQIRTTVNLSQQSNSNLVKLQIFSLLFTHAAALERRFVVEFVGQNEESQHKFIKVKWVNLTKGHTLSWWSRLHNLEPKWCPKNKISLILLRWLRRPFGMREYLSMLHKIQHSRRHSPWLQQISP